MNAISKLALATLIAASAATSAAAQDAHAGHGAHGAPAQAGHAASHGGHHSAVAGEMATGEIKKVDKDAGKITIRHGELKNLNMPAMTMVFRVKDATMLAQVKAGDSVKFVAEKVNGALTITKLEGAK
jgi:Cu/Ag efflux protein CusF